MVLDTVASPNSRRNYGKALDDLERYLGSDQEIAVAVNDNLGL